MTLPCSILTNIHPMVGVDIHLGTIGPPDPPKPMIHFVAQFLGGISGTAKLQPTILSHNFLVVNQSSDIGMGIGHVAPNILFPLYVLTSSSASYFGSFSVLSGGRPTASAVKIFVNDNSNCGFPCNLPTGLVVAPGCNMVGMGLADFLAGLASMAINTTISLVTGYVGGKLGGKLASTGLGAIANIAGRYSVSAGLTTAIIFSTKFVSGVSDEVIGTALGKFTAGPTGTFETWVNDGVTEAIVPTYSRGEKLN